MSPTNRALLRFVVIGLPLLAVGGCVVAALLPSGDGDGLTGDPVPRSHYELTSRVCFSIDSFGGGAFIENTSDRARRFRIVARGEDPSAPDRDHEVEVVTRWVPAGEGALVSLPPWPWATALDEASPDVGAFTCNWAVFEP